MASAEQYAQWIINNADKRGTPEFDTVSQAYQIAKDPNAKYKAKSSPVPVDPTADMSTGQKLAAGAGKFAYDIGRGFSQRLGGMTPQQVDEANAVDAPLMNTTAGKIGYAGGAIAGTVPLMFAPGANTMAGSVGYGALTGALTPTGVNDRPELNTAIGGLLGGAGHAVGRLIGGGAPVSNSNNAARQNLVDIASSKYGIDLPTSTRTGNQRLAYLESQMAQLPGGGAMQQAIRRPQEQLAGRVMTEAGGSGGLATSAELAAAKSNTQRGYQNIWAGNTVKVDAQLASDLDAAWKSAQRILSESDQRVVRKQIDNIWDKTRPVKGSATDIEIPGDVYQVGLRSELRKASPADGPLMNALKDVRVALDSAANRSVGKSSATALKDLNREYAIQKAIAPLIPAAEARGGTFTPSGLLGPLGQFSGDIGELAKIGPLLREVPNSGTATRAAVTGGLLGGPALMAGGPAAAAAALAIPYTANLAGSKILANPAIQKYLAQGFGGLNEMEKQLVLNAVKTGAISSPHLVNAAQQ